MESKKGQALEFLITYGWAIVVIIIVLGLLVFIGYFTPSLPEICKPKSSGWSCTRFRLTTDGYLNFDASPGIRALTITNIKCTQENGIIATGGSTYYTNVSLQPGERVTFSSIRCHDSNGVVRTSFTIGEEYKGKINLQYYYNEEGLTSTRQEQFDLIARASANTTSSCIFLILPPILLLYLMSKEKLKAKVK